MNALDRVRELLLRLAPKAACDNCIAGSLGLSQRRHAGKQTRALAQADGFLRRKGVCRICGETREVISAKGS